MKVPTTRVHFDPGKPKDHSALMKQSQRLASQAFFGTMLKQMRNSPFKSEMFSGGKGGEAFAGMYDQHLADRMAAGSGRRLAASMVKHIEHGKAIKAAQAVTEERRGATGYEAINAQHGEYLLEAAGKPAAPTVTGAGSIAKGRAR